MLLYVPVDEGRLPGRVVADQHHANLFPWGQELQVQILKGEKVKTRLLYLDH